MSEFKNNLMFIVLRRHWFCWVFRDVFDVYLMFISVKNGVFSCNSVKGQSGWKRWYCVVCGILCNFIIYFRPRYEPKGQGFESLAARQKRSGTSVLLLFLFLFLQKARGIRTLRRWAADYAARTRYKTCDYIRIKPPHHRLRRSFPKLDGRHKMLDFRRYRFEFRWNFSAPLCNGEPFLI